jgi:hypothetical protein
MWGESHIGSRDGLALRFRHHSVLTRERAPPIKKTCARDVGPEIVDLGKRQGSKQPWWMLEFWRLSTQH